MPLVASITINAPARVVREVLLDFDKLSEWHTGDVFFTALRAPDGKKGIDVVEGDKVRLSVPEMSFSATVASNTPGHFSWLASIPLLYHAHHHFHFTPSPEDPNVTIFNQEETFSGLLARLIRSENPTSTVGKGIMKNFAKLNNDLKLRSEAVYAE